MNSQPNGAPQASREPRSPYAWTDLARELANVGAARDWLVEGAIEGRPLALLVGPEKAGKSWIAMDLAAACAAGGAWLGAFACRRPGPVVYLDSEYGPHEFARRLARLARGRGLPPEQLAARVFHLYAPGLTLHHEDDAAVWVLRQACELRPSVIVIDPLRNALDGDENNAEDVKCAFSIAAQLRDATRAAILLTHHQNKQGIYSGSRAMMARADLILEADESGASYAARGRTIRTGDPVADPFAVTIAHDHDDDDSIAATRVRARLRGEVAPRSELSRPSLRVLSALREAGSPMSVAEVRRASGVSSGRTALAALEQLAAAGLAERRAGRWAVSTGEFFAGLSDPDPDLGRGEEGGSR